MTQEQIDNIIPTIYMELGSDEENESDELYRYYHALDEEGQTVVNKLMLYLTGWTWKTIVKKARTV